MAKQRSIMGQTAASLGQMGEGRKGKYADPYDPTQMTDANLRKTLCDGRGAACGKCASACGYGREWLRRKRMERLHREQVQAVVDKAPPLMSEAVRVVDVLKMLDRMQACGASRVDIETVKSAVRAVPIIMGTISPTARLDEGMMARLEMAAIQTRDGYAADDRTIVTEVLHLLRGEG